MGRRRNEEITFRVTESVVVDPERVTQGLAVWADYLARQVSQRRQMSHARPPGNVIEG